MVYFKILLLMLVLVLIFLGPLYYRLLTDYVLPMKRVHREITYKKDPEAIWQSASLTESIRTGDCEDFCILLYKRLGSLSKDFRFSVVKRGRDGTAHAVLIGKGMVLDPTNGRVYSVSDYMESHIWIGDISRERILRLTNGPA